MLEANGGHSSVLRRLHSCRFPTDQVPQEEYDMYAGITNEARRRYTAMVRWLDTGVASITALLKARGMWNNTLFVLTSDNGGPVYGGGSAGANNYPLRGGKASQWQGGIRVNALVSGGLIPPRMRGTKLEGLACVWDFYATFAALAGVDPTDHLAARHGLPPIDSIDLWPYLCGESKVSPRKSIPIGEAACTNPRASGCLNAWGFGEVRTIVQGLIEDRGDDGLWKLLLDANAQFGHQGPWYPNGSSTHDQFRVPNGVDYNRSAGWVRDCGRKGCLYRLDLDPSEDRDLSAAHPAIAASMLAVIAQYNLTTSVIPPDFPPVLHGRPKNFSFAPILISDGVAPE